MSNNTAIEKFEPGPWVWHEQGEASEHVLLKNNKRWIIAFRLNGELHRERERATAQLIAEAPELYNALKDAQNEICRLYNKLKELDFKNSLYYWNEEKATIGKYDELINRINQ